LRTDLPIWLTPTVVVAGFLVFLWIETLRPLRVEREPKLRRIARNLATAGVGLATVELLQIPILIPISRWTMTRGIGLLNQVEMAAWARVAISFVLLDYTLWFWHWINHRVPFFWRFHSVHHVDRDLDVSTGVRFHFGELGLSIGFRALQVTAISADPVSVAIWQMLLFVSVLFHHSNTRLPLALERVLVRFVVTPRMHGIHHSDYENETNTNWSSLLSVWDYLHGTIRLDVPQPSITIGVPAFDDPKKVTLGKILAMPFRRWRGYWRRPDGSAAVRPHADGRMRLEP
jgi:sterol desaturase/sphingolipid hydroxylase (fatty acid hydroxylase superfamily)